MANVGTHGDSHMHQFRETAESARISEPPPTLSEYVNQKYNFFPKGAKYNY